MPTLNDAAYDYYLGAVAGTLPPVETAPSSVTENTSVTANGSVTSPGANAAIATTPDLSAGTWEIECTAFVTGTTVAALESDNLRFRIGDTAIATIIAPVPGTTGATGLSKFNIRVNLGGTAPVSVASGVAATTGAIYKASIIANKVK